MELKLKRHETFSIREGWIEKGLHYIHNDPNCFTKEKGTLTFGLGTNMVKSLRYWLVACKLAYFKNGIATLTTLGNLIYHNDPYLDDNFSVWLIHLFLATNDKDAPVFNAIFNLEYSQFDKDILMDKVPEKLEKYGFEPIKSKSSLESDITIFLRSYYSIEDSNPENNMICPISKLDLFSCDDKKIFVRKVPKIKKLDFRIVYLCLKNYIESKQINSFNIEDIYSERNNPLKVLNLSKSGLFYYLEEMQKRNYIKLNKTAGLNVVYFDQIKTITEVVNDYFNGGR